MDAQEAQNLDQLLRWDELSTRELARLEGDPRASAQLEHLQAADRWLEDSLRTVTAATRGACPPAEELYDFGQGPGFDGLGTSRSTEISRHVEICEPCGSLVASLQSRPPSPLDLAPLQSETPALDPELTPIHSLSEERSRRFEWPLVAAAAAVLVALFGLWQTGHAPRGAEVLAALPGGFPESPLLRGGSDALAFPRGLVLERNTSALAPWATGLTFELEPETEVDSYRIELRRHAGDAFEAGTPLGILTGTAPTLEADATLLSTLTPGRYTWEAWSLRAGLERRLGARDFEIQQGAPVWNILEESLEENGALDARAVRYLHELGLVTDAQRLARTLPSSPERDAYLSANLR